MVAVSAVRGARPAVYLLAAPSALDRLVHGLAHDALVSLGNAVVLVHFYRELSLAFIMPRGFSSQLAIISNPRLGRRPKHQLGFRNDAGNRVTEGIVTTVSMVDAVTSAARCATLKSAKLRAEARVIQQFAPAGIEQRQHVAVKVRLGFVGRLIANPMRSKSLTRPLAGVAVASDAMNAVALEQSGEFDHHVVRRKGRLTLADGIEHGA